MKILYATFNLSGGGAERQLSYLAPALAQRGHEVHVAYVQNDVQLSIQDDNLHFHHLESISNYDPRILLQLISLIKRIQPDMIHSWILQADIYSALAAKLTCTMWLFREPDAAKLRESLPFKFKIRQMLARWATAIVANSFTGIEHWAEKFPSKVLRVIRNGYPVDEMVLNNSKPADHAGTCFYEKQLLYVGRLSPEKNVEILINSLCHVSADVKLIICGSGQCESEYFEKAKHLNILQRIEFIGHVDRNEVWSLMETSDALALVSHFEGFPNVLIEAMLKRCPIIVSDIQTHREFLDEKTAYFVDKDDPKTIAKAIKDVMNRSGECMGRIESAFQLARKFTIPKMVDCYEGLYKDLVIGAISKL